MEKYEGIIFFDLDGTLLDGQSKINEKNLAILNQLAQKNYLSVIASGRSPIEIETIIQKTAITSYVSLNGQYVVVEGKVFAKHVIPTDLISQVLTFAADLGHPVACYTPYEYKINFVDEATQKLYQLDNAPLPAIDPTYYQKQEIQMLYLFSENTQHDALFVQRFGDSLTFFRDSPYSMAIVNKNRSKKAGIVDLLQQLQIENLDNTYAFGDGENDISMFEAVKHSIAMGNAKEQVKKAATEVTTANDADGIEKALKKLGIL